MKSSHFFKNNFIIAVVLCVLTLISLLLHLTSPHIPYMNADEAAFGYNAYSIAQTGKDEYGVWLPSRLQSFSDNKLPLLSYLIVPFVAVFGLNEFAIRLPTLILATFSPLLFFILAKHITKNKSIALIAALFASVSPWIHTISRQTHETILASTLLMLTFLFFFKFSEKLQLKDIILSSAFLMLSLFAYHTSKVFVVFFAVWLLVIIRQRKMTFKHASRMLLIFFIPLLFFVSTELMQPSVRVANLLFYKEPGFEMNILERLREHDSRIIHNKVTHAFTYLSNRYITYFAPEFLVIHGDENPRFGFTGISPVSLVEYILLLTGIFFLFKKKESYRYPLLFLLLTAPLAASLAWQDYSITRAFCMIVPLIIIAAYGAWNLYHEINNKWLRLATYSVGIFFYIFSVFYSYEFYFHHYSKNPVVTRAFQAGYKELADVIKTNYDTYDTIYISPDHGQPYIFMLFYLKYPPSKYQEQAHIEGSDTYGFGSVKKFDKFIFEFKPPQQTKNALIVGYPAQFTSLPEEQKINLDDIKKITIGNEDIFWYYETK